VAEKGFGTQAWLLCAEQCTRTPEVSSSGRTVEGSSASRLSDCRSASPCTPATTPRSAGQPRSPFVATSCGPGQCMALAVASVIHTPSSTGNHRHRIASSLAASAHASASIPRTGDHGPCFLIGVGICRRAAAAPTLTSLPGRRRLAVGNN
jgi:hypothetical protein